MATKTTVTLIDDIDETSAAETVTFAIDGKSYEIDLNEKNAKALRDAVGKYVAHARHVGGRRVNLGGRGRPGPAGGGKHSREQLQAIRAWARKRGHQVSDRGRISAAIIEEFETSH